MGCTKGPQGQASEASSLPWAPDPRVGHARPALVSGSAHRTARASSPEPGPEPSGLWVLVKVRVTWLRIRLLVPLLLVAPWGAPSPPRLSICLCLSVCLCLSLSALVCRSLHVLSVCLCVCFSLSLFPSVSVCLPASLFSSWTLARGPAGPTAAVAREERVEGVSRVSAAEEAGRDGSRRGQTFASALWNAAGRTRQEFGGIFYLFFIFHSAPPSPAVCLFLYKNVLFSNTSLPCASGVLWHRRLPVGFTQLC